MTPAMIPVREYAGRRVLVLGLARSGLAVARALAGPTRENVQAFDEGGERHRCVDIAFRDFRAEAFRDFRQAGDDGIHGQRQTGYSCG